MARLLSFPLVVVFLIYLSGSPLCAFAQNDDPPPPPAPSPTEITVQQISYGGSGCPQGSVGNSFALDRKSFTLIFDSFIASMGPGVPATESTKTCQLSLSIKVPGGIFVEKVHTDFRGFRQLPEGVTSEVKTVVRLQGKTIHKTKDRSSGALTADYIHPTDFKNFFKVSEPCGELFSLDITVTASLTAAGQETPSAQLTIDSVDQVHSSKLKHAAVGNC